MTDCIVFAFLIPEFLHLMYTLKSMNFKDQALNAVAHSISNAKSALKK